MAALVDKQVASNSVRNASTSVKINASLRINGFLQSNEIIDDIRAIIKRK